ncbi:lanthionine synthetase C-like protein [Kordia sp. SMS9]|uniref:lanthionine synthetase LanC family protein n=1 Tax=Kordia sp. SMS9 TaxID=2282170 RepID=UPI000E0CE2AA|nr:lanthionine synthetase LanC family protein [Kordia sp. SMS9]AXG68167.1 lanthionine synthetase C-like protein [Kordia sp. SMS9]
MKEIHETIKPKNFTYNTEELYVNINALHKRDENSAGWMQILLCYIDSYSVQRNAETRTQLHSLMELYHQCVQKIKGDCSFEKGKAGFLYAALRLSEVDTSKTFIDDAFALLEKDIHNFIISPYTNNTINAGRSGCLLVLQYYYDVTNDAKAKKWIDALAEKMIAEAQITDKGIFWKDRLEKQHGLLNFEYGNAGIGTAFLILSEAYHQDEFVTIAKQIYSYQRQFWDENLGWKATKKGMENTKTYQAALEAVQQENSTFFGPLLDNLFIHVGVAKFTLHLWQKTADETIKNELITYLERCTKLYEDQKATLATEKHLLLGTLFWEVAQILKDEKYAWISKTISNFIQEKQAKQTIENFEDAVIAAQITHFQLALENETIRNAVIPAYTIPQRNSEVQTLPINLKESVLQNTFKRTLAYLKTHHEKLISDYLAQPIEEKVVFNFMMFIKKNLHQFPIAQKKQVSEILKLEISLQNLKKSIKNYAQLEAKNIHTYQKVQAIFNQSDEVVKTHTLQLNPKAKKLITSWSWEQKQGNISQENLQLPESKTNVYILPYYTHLIKEYWQHPNNVVLEYFKNQTQIAVAIAQLKQFYLSQDAIYIDNFSQFVMAASSYVLENLDTILLKIIKEYMAIGLLEIVENRTKSN